MADKGKDKTGVKQEINIGYSANNPEPIEMKESAENKETLHSAPKQIHREVR